MVQTEFSNQKQKYILIYYIEEYIEMGGGINVEYFNEQDLMHNQAQKLLDKHKEKFKIERAGYLQLEYKYEK